MSQDFRFCTAKDGVKLAYAVSGDGPPLVMSATWLTHLDHQWRSLAWRPWLHACARGRKLLRYDARGCGLSDRDTTDFSFDNWVSDIECAIDAAGFGHFDLLGTCWGGPIAIAYAARHPERVNRLILYGTYALGRLRYCIYVAPDEQTRADARRARRFPGKRNRPRACRDRSDHRGSGGMNLPAAGSHKPGDTHGTGKTRAVFVR